MTEKKKTEGAEPLSLFRLEGERSRSGMSFIFGGIVAVSSLSDEEVELKSHGAKVRVIGKRLSVSLYENRNIEVKGRVEHLEFIYGRN